MFTRENKITLTTSLVYNKICIFLLLITKQWFLLLKLNFKCTSKSYKKGITRPICIGKTSRMNLFKNIESNVNNTSWHIQISKVQNYMLKSLVDICNSANACNTNLMLVYNWLWWASFEFILLGWLAKRNFPLGSYLRPLLRTQN